MKSMGKNSTDGQTISVCVVVPVLNEAKYIASCVESILSQTYPCKVLILDGGSTDGTLEILAKYAQDVTILHNPGKHVGPARNLALNHLGDSVSHCLEMIGHATIPKDHVEKRVRDLEELERVLDRKVGAIGTKVLAVEDVSGVESWIESALSSPFGSGGGQFANFKGQGKTKVPAFALQSIEALRDVGGWDESFITSQDSDLSMRLSKKGWPIYRSDVSFVRMRKRSTLRSWWLMSHRYGFWRSKVLLSHPSRVDVREFLPLFGLIACFFWYQWLIPLYGFVLLGGGLIQVFQRRQLNLLWGHPLCLLILHTGFTLGLFDGLFRKGKASKDRS